MTRLANSRFLRLMTPAVICAFAPYTFAHGVPEHHDAEILKWDQTWTLNDDGRIVYEELKQVKLLDDRAYREFADPRIEYLKNQETYEVISAKTILPDGKELPVPDYSVNEVSPRNLANWPDTAEWREVVYSFPGVMQGAVLELHYKRTSNAAAGRNIQADLRLNGKYPVKSRKVRVNVPPGLELKTSLTGVDSSTVRSEQDVLIHFTSSVSMKFSMKGVETKIDNKAGPVSGEFYQWEFSPEAMKAVEDEPNASHWSRRCGRLRFTTAPGIDDWCRPIIRAVESAANADQPMKKFVEVATKDATQRGDRARKIQEAFAKTFSLENDLRAWRGLRCRSAAEVFSSTYGNQLEAAAALTALLRAADLSAEPVVVVDGRSFDENTPLDSDLEGVFVSVLMSSHGDEVLFAPADGVAAPSSHWMHHQTIRNTAGGQFEVSPALIERAGDRHAIRVSGQVKFAEDATATGNLNIHLSGIFQESEKAREESSREKLIKKIVSGSLSGWELESSSISRLSDIELDADAKVKTSKPLDSITEGMHLLSLTGTGLMNTLVHIPLDHSTRTTPVQLPASGLVESWDITVHWPENWKAEVMPQTINATGPWGRIAQRIETKDNGCRILRDIQFSKDLITGIEFEQVRSALAQLSQDAANVFVLNSDAAEKVAKAE